MGSNGSYLNLLWPPTCWLTGSYIASGPNTAVWRAANPGVVLSHYIPYTRDPGCPQMSGKKGPQCDKPTSPFVDGCPTCLP
jgi:hypothetical protein